MRGEEAGLKRMLGVLGGDIRIWVIVVVVLGTFAVGLRNQFVWDDIMFIVHNEYLHDPGNIPRFLVSGDAEGTGLLNPYYRPLATASFALDYAIWGERPAGFHATNIALHLLTCLVLYRVIRRITGNPSASLVATLLFSVHPANSEPVGYISSRADILCALFLLLSFLGFLRATDTGKRRDLALSLVAFSLALFSKIVALILPPLLAVYLMLYGNREKWVRSLVPYVTVSIAFLVLRSWVLTMEVWGPIPFPIRVANAGLFLVDYLQNALFPVGLKVFYDPDLKMTPSNLASIAAWVGLAGIGAGVLFIARRRPLFSFGIVWFFAALMPVCGLVTMLYPACMADRYLYIPLIGLAISATSLWEDVLPRDRSWKYRAAMAVIVGIMVLASSAGTARRLLEWRNSLTLWSAAVEDAPLNLYPKNGLGSAYMARGLYNDAERILKGVIAIRDDSVQPRINLAGIEYRRGNIDAMEIHVNRVLELQPAHCVALTYLGIIKAKRGWTDEASRLFEEVIRLNPGDAAARDNLACLKREKSLRADLGNLGLAASIE